MTKLVLDLFEPLGSFFNIKSVRGRHKEGGGNKVMKRKEERGRERKREEERGRERKREEDRGR